MIELRNVSKSFSGIKALDEVNIQIPKGAITVLLGPNGAGKTTAIRLLTGALSPTVGEVETFGLDPTGISGEEVRKKCGIVSAKPALYDRLNGYDNLLYAAELYGLEEQKIASRIQEAAARFQIEHALDQQVGGYSTGMKTRLALARAVLHNPDFLLLDEPTSGLDPESASAVLKLIRIMTQEGQTVLMCTHLLLEAEGLADHIVIMDKGKTITSGTPDQLTKKIWPNVMFSVEAENGEQLDSMKEFPGVKKYSRTGQIANFDLASESIIADMIIEMSNRNIRIVSAAPHRPSLEDLYFAIRQNSVENKTNQEYNKLIKESVGV